MSADLLGAVAGPWTVTNVDADGWHEVSHKDGTKRLVKRYAVEDLLRGAHLNGLVSVRAKAAEAPKPIEAVPLYSLGNPADNI